MYQAGKLEIIKKEAKKLKLDILVVSEVRWTGSGMITSDDWTFYYSGGEKDEAGVGLLLQKKLAEALIACWQVS